MNGAIAQLENLFEVTYWSEYLKFSRMIDDAENYVRSTLAPEIERRVLTGETKEWVR